MLDADASAPPAGAQPFPGEGRSLRARIRKYGPHIGAQYWPDMTLPAVPISVLSRSLTHCSTRQAGWPPLAGDWWICYTAGRAPGEQQLRLRMIGPANLLL